LDLLVADELGLARSNRTIVGLKLQVRTNEQSASCSSNRTIVGLKLHLPIAFGDCVNCSNRTIVGLKLNAMPYKDSAKKLQQSHHCGIETRQVA